jgi:hypothetical protein
MRFSQRPKPLLLNLKGKMTNTPQRRYLNLQRISPVSHFVKGWLSILVRLKWRHSGELMAIACIPWVITDQDLYFDDTLCIPETASLGKNEFHRFCSLK